MWTLDPLSLDVPPIQLFIDCTCTSRRNFLGGGFWKGRGQKVRILNCSCPHPKPEIRTPQLHKPTGPLGLCRFCTPRDVIGLLSNLNPADPLRQVLRLKKCGKPYLTYLRCQHVLALETTSCVSTCMNVYISMYLDVDVHAYV